jgi:predicted transcriptional regulator
MPDSSSSSPVLEQFAHRIATRDEVPPVLLTPEAIQERLGAALGARLGTKDPRRRRTLSRIAYALMAERWQTNAQLGAAAGLTAQAAQRVADSLVREGLLEVYREKNTRVQCLSRAGEDWLLPHAQGTAT